MCYKKILLTHYLYFYYSISVKSSIFTKPSELFSRLLYSLYFFVLMDYKKELQNEYSNWNNKRVKRKHRVIQVKNFTKEQIYHQIKDITEIATKEVEEYLVDYIDKENHLSNEEEYISSESEDSASKEIENNIVEIEETPIEKGVDIMASEEEYSDGSGTISITEDEEKTSGKNSDIEEELEAEKELDEFNDASSEANYNSEELDDIYNYLEGGEESTELLTEPAEETLRKLRK